MDDYEVYSEESNAERMQKRANNAAKNMGWQKGKAVRDVLSNGQVRVEYPPMNIDAHNAAMNALASTAEAEWVRTNPDAYYGFKHNTRPMPESIMNQVSPDAYIKDKGWNHRPLPEVFAKQAEAIWKAHHPTMVQASAAPSYTIVHGRPMVDMPASVTDAPAYMNRDSVIWQGPQSYTARYNGEDVIRPENIFSDAAQEYGQGSTSPITKDQAVTQRMANANEMYRDAKLEGERAIFPQNYNQKGRASGSVPRLSYADYEDFIRGDSGAIGERNVAMTPSGKVVGTKAPSFSEEWNALKSRSGGRPSVQAALNLLNEHPEVLEQVNSRLNPELEQSFRDKMASEPQEMFSEQELNEMANNLKGQTAKPKLEQLPARIQREANMANTKATKPSYAQYGADKFWSQGMKYPNGKGPMFNVPDSVRNAYQGAKGVAKGVGRVVASPEMVALIGGEAAAELAEMQYLNAPTDVMVEKLMQEGVSEEEARALVGYNDEAYRNARDTSRPASWVREQDAKKRNYVYDDNPNHR